jgi:hypothetical protein
MENVLVNSGITKKFMMGVGKVSGWKNKNSK